MTLAVNYTIRIAVTLTFLTVALIDDAVAATWSVPYAAGILAVFLYDYLHIRRCRCER